MKFIGPGQATLMLALLLIAVRRPLEAFVVACLALTMPRL